MRLVATTLLLLASCASPAPAPASCPVSDAPRPFLMGSTGVRLALGEDPLYAQDALPELDDIDVLVIHEDFLGVPWAELAAGEDPPGAWVDAIDVLVENARSSGKPVMLSTSLVNTGRTHLAHRASEVDGQLRIETGWSADCYDFSTADDADAMRRAYIAYLRYMVDRFEPRWLNHAPEINLFANCGAQPWGALVDTANQAYDAIKADHPDLVVFPSFQVEHLRALPNEACLDGEAKADCEARHREEIGGLKRDRFAVSVYPYSEWSHAGDVPDDHITGLVPDGERMLISETGWISEDIRAEGSLGCQTLVQTSPEEAYGWMTTVLETAESADAELLVWWSNRDLLEEGVSSSCPCDPDSGHCETIEAFRAAFGDDPDTAMFGEMVYKAYGTMGLRHADGSPKEPLASCWAATRERPR